MGQPVVVVAEATDGNAGETASVAEAAIEASASAFQAGVYAGEDAARRDSEGMVSRAEFDQLVARVDAIQGQAEVAEVAASVAVDIALEAAEQATEAAEEASESAGEGDGEGEGVKPPERREEAPAEAAPPKRDGYGSDGWFGKRKS